jgi:ABC-2 type transport system permease protein
MNIAVLLVASGVSSVFSSFMPYPATRPGDSPFAQPAVQGSGAGLAQTLSMLVALVLALPPVLFAAYAIAYPTFELNVMALVLGVLWGLILLGLGVLIGGKAFDRGAPELIAVTQTFD